MFTWTHVRHGYLSRCPTGQLALHRGATRGVLTWVLLLFVAFVLRFRWLCLFVGSWLSSTALCTTTSPDGGRVEVGQAFAFTGVTREAGLAFMLGARPAVQLGGQHCEMGVAGPGTDLEPLLLVSMLHCALCCVVHCAALCVVAVMFRFQWEGAMLVMWWLSDELARVVSKGVGWR